MSNVWEANDLSENTAVSHTKSSTWKRPTIGLSRMSTKIQLLVGTGSTRNIPSTGKWKRFGISLEMFFIQAEKLKKKFLWITAAHICDECGKSFSSPGRLSSHINVAHINHAADYICHICAKQFSCRSNLTYHLTTHQPKIHQVQWWEIHF